jgi:phosphoribosylformylglycinamidine cyclo-ligase
MITYKDSGVNIDKANSVKNEMKSILDTDNKKVLNKVGAFASLIDLGLNNYKDPILVMKTEEPGSKQKLAIDNNKVESICYDMINHLINDIIVMGATPLVVQDAIICGELQTDIVKRLVKGMSEACKEQGCNLIGGETSEQPSILKSGNYILTSSIIGIVERNNIIDGTNIKVGNKIIALASNGPHTNGYSLIRKLIPIINDDNFLEVILKPHTCYYNLIKILLKYNINGMAHITGGGIKENLNRILNNVDANIYLDKIDVLPVFKLIKKVANLNDVEMLRTFNCGVGMVLVVEEKYVDSIIADSVKYGINAYEIGEIIEGTNEVKFINYLI